MINFSGGLHWPFRGTNRQTTRREKRSSVAEENRKGVRVVSGHVGSQADRNQRFGLEHRAVV